MSSECSFQLHTDFSECGNLACRVVGLVEGQEVTTMAPEGTEAAVILDKTCFYAEGGGQTADVGTLVSQVLCVCE